VDSVPDHVRNFMYEMRSSAWDLHEGTPCTATAPCPDFSESRSLVDELRKSKQLEADQVPPADTAVGGLWRAAAATPKDSAGFATSQMMRMHLQAPRGVGKQPSNLNFKAGGFADVPVDPSTMCISEMKGWLNAHGVDFAGCCEKVELVRLIHQASAPDAGAPENPDAPHHLPARLFYRCGAPAGPGETFAVTRPNLRVDWNAPFLFGRPAFESLCIADCSATRSSVYVYDGCHHTVLTRTPPSQYSTVATAAAWEGDQEIALGHVPLARLAPSPEAQAAAAAGKVGTRQNYPEVRVVLLAEDTQASKIILGRTVANCPKRPFCWCLPSAQLEDGEDILAAARRVMSKNLALDSRCQKVVGVFETIEVVNSILEHRVDLFVHCLVDDAVPLEPRADEIDSLLWLDCDDVAYVATSEPPQPRKPTELKHSLLGWEVNWDCLPDVFSHDGAQNGIDMSSCVYDADQIRGLYPNAHQQGQDPAHQWALLQWLQGFPTPQ